MDCAKQRKLVQSLVNLTRVGSIDWKPSLRANVFQVSFHENTVRIGLKEGRRQEEGGIMIQLVNSDGVVVESFTNVDLQAKHTCINPQPWFPIMMDLFDEARRSALGADKERLIAVLCGWDAQPVGFVVWRIGESRSSGRCETLSFSKRR